MQVPIQVLFPLLFILVNFSYSCYSFFFLSSYYSINFPPSPIIFIRLRLVLPLVLFLSFLFLPFTYLLQISSSPLSPCTFLVECVVFTQVVVLPLLLLLFRLISSRLPFLLTYDLNHIHLFLFLLRTSLYSFFFLFFFFCFFYFLVFFFLLFFRVELHEDVEILESAAAHYENDHNIESSSVWRMSWIAHSVSVRKDNYRKLKNCIGQYLAVARLAFVVPDVQKMLWSFPQVIKVSDESIKLQNAGSIVTCVTGSLLFVVQCVQLLNTSSFSSSSSSSPLSSLLTILDT